MRPGSIKDVATTDLPKTLLALESPRVAGDTRFIGRESVAELQGRITPTLKALFDDSGWDTALLVLHALVNNAILSMALTGDLGLLRSLRSRRRVFCDHRRRRGFHGCRHQGRERVPRSVSLPVAIEDHGRPARAGAEGTAVIAPDILTGKRERNTTAAPNRFTLTSLEMIVRRNSEINLL